MSKVKANFRGQGQSSRSNVWYVAVDIRAFTRQVQQMQLPSGL